MTTLSVADARANFSKLVESAQTTHERFDVTRNGSRVAVLVGADDFDALLETIEILGDPQVMQSIAIAEAELDAGEYIGVEELRAQLAKAGRLRE